MKRAGIVLVLIAFSVGFLRAEDGRTRTKRGRNEGTINIPASNVVGNGNITLYSTVPAWYGSRGFGLNPSVGMKVGIAHVLQISGKVTVDNFTRLGGVEAHLQCTTPKNDRLRLFGVAVSGDMYLSTDVDTLSGAAVSGRPDYNAYLKPSLIADIDWITLLRWLPLKTYCALSMADNPALLYRYSQLSVRFGLEYKLEHNSYSIDLGAGFYKEKSGKLSGSEEDPSYKQQRVWIEPSIRYRLFDRGSLVAGLRVLLFQRVKKANPLEREYSRLSVRVELPVFFRETNSEAIRTMMFIERGKKTTEEVPSAVAEEKSFKKLEAAVEGLDLEVLPSESESEILKKREEIQRKMDDIEKLLEDLE